MSQENVGVVRRLLAFWNENDQMPPELFDANVTFTTRGELEGRSVFSGHDRLLRGFSEFRDAWQQIRVQPTEFVVGENCMVAIGRFDLRSRSGVDLKVEEAWAYWFRDGRIVRVEEHGTRDAALEAVGLSE